MQDYISLGHVYIFQSVPYVLLYDCVEEEFSSTTQVKMVFSDSSPDASGESLNSMLI